MSDSISLMKCYANQLPTNTLPIGTPAVIVDTGKEGLVIGTPSGNVILPRSSDLGDFTKITEPNIIQAIVNNKTIYNDTGSAANIYAITVNNPPTALTGYLLYRFKAANTNTGASTLTVNTFGAKSIVKSVNVPLAAGDILAGQIVTTIFDGTNFQIIPDYSALLATINANIATNTANITTINTNLNAPVYQNAVTTNTELNPISTTINKQAKITDIQGQTIVNILGTDGDCEDITKYINNNGCTLALDSANKVFGSNGIKITIATGQTWAAALKDITAFMDKTQYYCISAYVKNGNYTNGITMTFGNGTTTYNANVAITDTTKFNKIYLKLQPSNYGASTNALNIGNSSVGAVGQYGWMDGIQIEKITSAQYADNTFTGSPYVNSDYSVGDSVTRIKTRGKNLINLIQSSVTSCPLRLVNDFTRLTHKDAKIPVKPSTNYVVSLNTGLLYAYSEWDKNQSLVNSVGYGSTTTGFTFTTGANTNYITITFKIDDVTNIFAENYNIQVEEGSVATTYEAYKETYLNTPQPLRSLPNGVIDEIVSNVGTVGKTNLIQRIGKIVLDGSLSWSYSSVHSGTGYKCAYVPYTLSITGTPRTLKYNNKDLVYTSGLNVSDEFFYDGNIYIVISSADSGWGDSYTPTAQEIQAYFNGWKMCISGSALSSIYNGTGTKAWTELNRAIATPNDTIDSIATVPTITANYNAGGYTPYRLYYQLATPVVTELNQPNLVSMPNGALLMESDSQSWIRPTVTYQIADNEKANIDEVMKHVSDFRRFLNFVTTTTGYLNINSVLNANGLNTNAGTSGGGTVHYGLRNNNSLRIGMGLANSEGTGNVGSDFDIWGYDNNGNFLASYLLIKRSNGAIYTKNNFLDDGSGNAQFSGNVTVGGYNALKALSGGSKVQSGSTTVTVATAGVQVGLSITFPVPFTGTPVVSAVMSDVGSTTATYINVSAHAPNLAGFTLGANSGVAQTITVTWIAIGN